MKSLRWVFVAWATTCYAVTVAFVWALCHDLTTHKEWSHNTGVTFAAANLAAFFLAGCLFLVAAIVAALDKE